MSRSKWKNAFIDNLFTYTKIKNSTKKHKIWSRSSVITSQLIGKAVEVYNGKEFKTLFISREKIGFKFGQFISTRLKRKVKKKKPNTLIKSKKKV